MSEQTVDAALSAAATALLDSADDTGCSEDLIVVDARALEAFKAAYQKWWLGDSDRATSVIREFVKDIEIIGARTILKEARVSESDTDPGWPDLVSTYERAKAFLGEEVTEDLAE